MAVEEREQQNADVASVHVGIRHAHDAVIPELRRVEILSEAAAERGDHRLDLVVGEDAVKPRLFHVQNLAAQRQDGLKVPVAPGLGAAAGAVALDKEDFALGGVALGAVRQLARQGAGFQRGLSARHVARLAGGLAGARRGDALVQHGAADGRVFLEHVRQPRGHHAVHQRANLAVAQLGLGLSLKLRLHQLDRHDRRQTLAHVVAGQVRVRVL